MEILLRKSFLFYKAEVWSVNSLITLIKKRLIRRKKAENVSHNSGLHKGYIYNIYIYICIYNLDTVKTGLWVQRQVSYFRHLVTSYKECFLTEGVHEDHASVSVVAVGWRAGLRQVVLGERGRRERGGDSRALRLSIFYRIVILSTIECGYAHLWNYNTVRLGSRRLSATADSVAEAIGGF